MGTDLDKKIRASLAKATGYEISEKLDPFKVESWWDSLHPSKQTGILEDLGAHKGATVILRNAKTFEKLDPEWQTEVEAYWKKHVLPKVKKQQEDMLSERFSSSDVRSAGKEAMAQMGKLSAGDETFIKTKIKSTHWKKITAAIEDVFSDTQKKEMKVGKQDVANVLAMMIRTGIEKEQGK